MTKPKKFKGNQATFRITFEGIDLMIDNVMVKEVEQGDGRPWAVLDENRGRWKLLTTPGYLIEPLIDDIQYLTFDRLEPEKPIITNGYLEPMVVKVHTQLNFGPEDKIYALDECPLGTRLQYTAALIPGGDHQKITRIIFEKVSK